MFYDNASTYLSNKFLGQLNDVYDRQTDKRFKIVIQHILYILFSMTQIFMIFILFLQKVVCICFLKLFWATIRKKKKNLVNEKSVWKFFEITRTIYLNSVVLKQYFFNLKTVSKWMSPYKWPRFKNAVLFAAQRVA